jgi:hypothetical protein
MNASARGRHAQSSTRENSNTAPQPHHPQVASPQPTPAISSPLAFRSTAAWLLELLHGGGAGVATRGWTLHVRAAQERSPRPPTAAQRPMSHIHPPQFGSRGGTLSALLTHAARPGCGARDCSVASARPGPSQGAPTRAAIIISISRPWGATVLGQPSAALALHWCAPANTPKCSTTLYYPFRL